MKDPLQMLRTSRPREIPGRRTYGAKPHSRSNWRSPPSIGRTPPCARRLATCSNKISRWVRIRSSRACSNVNGFRGNDPDRGLHAPERRPNLVGQRPGAFPDEPRFLLSRAIDTDQSSSRHPHVDSERRAARYATGSGAG